MKKQAFPASWTRSGVSLGFTLVELIVVVTILAILATIGFVSYSSYLTGVRDTNRLSQLVSISDGLELYRTKKDLPLPDDNVEVQVNGTIIAYQGYAGSNTLETIDFTKGGKDPKDDSYFTYYLTEDRKYFQLLGFLEEEENLSSQNQNLNISSSYAADYSNRLPTVYGKKLGVLTDINNSPIQEVISSGSLDVGTTTTTYRAYFKDNDVIQGDNSVLTTINPVASCKRIKQLEGGSSDGKYIINPSGTDGAEYEVYCDMTTDGGGWTLTTYIAEGYDPNYAAISTAYTSGENYYTDELKIANEYLLDTHKIVSEFAVDYQYGGLGDYTMNRNYVANMTAPTSYLGLSLVTNTSGDTYSSLASGSNVTLVSGTDYISDNIPNDIDLFCNSASHTIESMHSANFRMRPYNSALKVFFGYSTCGSIQGAFSARLDSNDSIELFAKDNDTDYEAKALRYWLR